MFFKPGDVIEKEKPYVAILDNKEKRKRCDYCFEEFKKLRRCSACKVMWFCSEHCQKMDWKRGHKFTECHVYQICNANKKQEPSRKTFIDYDTPRLLLRLYLYTYYNPDKMTKEHKTFEGKVRSLDRLMEHRADIRDHKDRMLIFNDIKMMFEESKIKYDEDLLFRLFCKMYINGFSVMNAMLNEIGRAIYFLTSQFDHSCVPNVITQFFGRNIEVRAIQEIDTEKQEIFVSYLNVMEKIDKRQEILARGYYFKCQCERCIFELKHYSETNPGNQIQNKLVCKCKPDEIISENKLTGTTTTPASKATADDKQESKKDEKVNPQAKDVKKDGKQLETRKPTDAKKDGKQLETRKPTDAKIELNIVDKSKEAKKEEIKSEPNADWQQVKKNRNQKGKKSSSKPTTPEPPVEAIKNDSNKSTVHPKEPVKIVETKVEEAKEAKETKVEEAKETKSVKATEQPKDEQKLELPNANQLKVDDKQQSKVRQTTRSPHQAFKNRQNSKSPLPRSKLARSPLPGNRLRLSKSPLANKNNNKKSTQSTDKQTDKKEDVQKNKKEKSPATTKKIPTPQPTRFVPYTQIERECLGKFDELNKQFTEKVEQKGWIEAFDLAKQLYKCYLTYYRGDYSAEITLHLIQMLQIKRNILKEKFNLHDKEVDDLFSQLRKNIMVTHGVAHHLYKTDYLDICQTIESTTKLIESK